MLYISFENDKGKISMGTGFAFRIIELDGLGLMQKTRNTAVYAGQVGQTLISETVGARVITIKGDIKLSQNAGRQIGDAIRILDGEGTLKICTNDKKRRIKCSVTCLELPKRSGAYQEFVVQFTADYPYFSDPAPSRKSVFSKTKLIRSPFSFPLVLSRRINKASVTNCGDVKTEPAFDIIAKADSASTGGILIRNNSTGKSITLSYQPQKDETITIDIENRKITSSLNGNITHRLSDDSFLSDFYLATGINEIEVIDGSEGDITAVCEFSNRYIEGVY